MKQNISISNLTLVPSEIQKVKQLSAALLAQQQHLFCANKAQENSTLASYEVAHLMARHGKPFPEDELIKGVSGECWHYNLHRKDARF